MTNRTDLEQAERDAASEAEAAADAAVDRQALLDNGEPAEDDENLPTANEYSIAFSPRNVAVGLAIVAGLVAVMAARKRNKRSSEGG
jgi:hypothetical protein